MLTSNGSFGGDMFALHEHHDHGEPQYGANEDAGDRQGEDRKVIPLRPSPAPHVQDRSR